MVDETVKIFSDPQIEVTATCVRVPVFGAHAESLNVQTREPLGLPPRASCWPRRPASRSSTTPATGATRRRSTPRARTRSTSAVSATTRPLPTASTSGSSPTTCARAPR